MGYVEQSLMTVENVRYRARLHWSIFVGPALLCLVVIGIVPLIARLVRRATSEFAVTNRRVIIKTGLIERKTLELNLSKVESIGIEQTLMGRMLGSGAIVVVGTGGTQERFPNLADPMGFRRAVNEATEALPVAAPRVV